MSRRHLCLACWRASRPEELSFRCPACTGDDAGPAWMRPHRGDSGLRPVREVRLPWWKRLVADGGDEVRCPRHPEATVELFCRCGAPLPDSATLVPGQTVGLGFAGPRSAGKTLFLLAAVRSLRGLRLDEEGRDVLSLLGLGDTEERFGSLERTLFEDRMRPAATDAGSELGPAALNFLWEVVLGTGGGHARREALLAVNDLSGETWRLDGEALQPELLERYLARVSSLVFLVDGAAVAADLDLEARDAWEPRPRTGGGDQERQWLAALADRLGRCARRTDLALTLSKADLLWEDEAWSALDPRNPVGDEARETLLEEALRRSGRGGLVESARARFRRVEVFAASALGFRPRRQDVDATGRLLRPPEPVGVAEPILWLLGQSVGRLGR